jgi:hypothetical protein
MTPLFSLYNIKITSFDLENPLGFADGTISIPKEVILDYTLSLVARGYHSTSTLSALDYCFVAAYAAGSNLS